MPNGKRMDVDPNGHMVTPVGDFWAQFLMEDYYYKGFLFGEGEGLDVFGCWHVRLKGYLFSLWNVTVRVFYN